MLTPNLLHDYQKKAVNHQCTHPQSMMWISMGLGKTIVTLTSIVHLLSAGYLRGHHVNVFVVDNVQAGVRMIDEMVGLC